MPEEAAGLWGPVSQSERYGRRRTWRNDCREYVADRIEDSFRTAMVRICRRPTVCYMRMGAPLLLPSLSGAPLTQSCIFRRVREFSPTERVEFLITRKQQRRKQTVLFPVFCAVNSLAIPSLSPMSTQRPPTLYLASPMASTTKQNPTHHPPMLWPIFHPPALHLQPLTRISSTMARQGQDLAIQLRPKPPAVTTAPI